MSKFKINKLTKILIIVFIFGLLVFSDKETFGSTLTNFSAGLGGWNIAEYSSVISPDPLYTHICGLGIDDMASLSINDLRINPNGYIDIETDLLGNYLNISEFYSFFNLRSIYDEEDLIIKLYLKTGQNYMQYFGEPLVYSVDQQIIFDSYPFSEPWHQLSLKTDGINNLDDVRAFGFRLMTNTGYGLNSSFYDYGPSGAGTSRRKFLFDNPGYIPEPATLFLFTSGFFGLFFTGWLRRRK